jgi:hypothetical protein
MNDMNASQVICPVCDEKDAVEKVSVLYLTGLGMRNPATSQPAGEASTPLADQYPGLRAALPELSRKLAPPASTKQAFSRPVHPDTAVLAFSVIAPFFLYGVWSTQLNTLPVVIAILAAFYLAYFVLRKKLVARFRAEQARQKAETERIRHGIERWMKLYYCARDDGVFEPGANELVPVDLLRSHLLQEA